MANRNEEHIEKVLKHRQLDTTFSFRCKKEDAIAFNLICERDNVDKSLLLRDFIIRYAKENK